MPTSSWQQKQKLGRQQTFIWARNAETHDAVLKEIWKNAQQQYLVSLFFQVIVFIYTDKAKETVFSNVSSRHIIKKLMNQVLSDYNSIQLSTTEYRQQQRTSTDNKWQHMTAIKAVSNYH